MYKDKRTVQELKETRIKSTFKVTVTLDLPYFDHHNYINMYLRDILDEISKKVEGNDLNGYLSYSNDELGHTTETNYDLEEEEEYNIHDWD